MKIVFAVAVAAGLALATACVGQNTNKTEVSGMDIKTLRSCDFYGEITITDTTSCKQTFYAGELKDKDTKDLILDFVEQGEKSHKLALTEDCEITEDSNAFKITAKNKSGDAEYTIVPGFVSDKKNGDILPVILLKGAGETVCYADENSYYRKYDDWEQIDAVFSDTVGFYISYDLKKDEFKTGEKEYTPNTEKTDIVLLRHYTNNAWFHADEGSFVDKNGNIYEFSFSSENFEPSPYDDLMTELKKIYNDPSTKPTGAYPNPDVFKILSSYADKIDPSAEINYEQAAFDAGQNTIYLIRTDGKTAFVHSTGDSDETSTDKYANMAYAVLERYR
ncbi:MAG: hypothetical protein IJR59_02845 [Firmicutes bacterium]|nr:hypothetical protein [Bacillota bacterium]